MMNAEQIARLVAIGESETLEFKSTTGARREAAMTVCAMLNQEGGRVLFGVTPAGRIVGQPVSEGTLEQLSAELAHIDPQAFPTIRRIPVKDGRDTVVVSVDSGSTKPYRYRGTAYRRVGNTTRRMGTEQYNNVLLERMHSEQRWENQPAVGWSIKDLDIAEVRKTVAEAVRTGRLNEPDSWEPEDHLRGLGLFRNGMLLRAAVVLFGNAERLQFEMPQCLLRVARFRGVDRSEFLDNRQFIGNAFTLLSHAERFLRDTLPIAGRFEPSQFQRIDEPLYPPLATREALANALCHRDYMIGGGSVGLALYDDRLEVTSTGGLHFGLTPDILFSAHDSRPWNPLIARTFYRRGIIEEWGQGILKMAEIAVSAGLPRPDIEDIGNCVNVCFRRAIVSPSRQIGNHVGRREVILALLKEVDGGLSLREIHAWFAPDTTKRQIRRDLMALRDRGLVCVSGTGPASKWTQEKSERK